MQLIPGYTTTETLREDEAFVLVRGQRASSPSQVLVKTSEPRQGAPSAAARLEHEYAIRAKLDPAWSVPPIELAPLEGQLSLVFADPGGVTLDRLLQKPRPLAESLGIAIGLAAALDKLHRSHLVHKDVKPANVLVGPGVSEVRLMNFGIASELPCERQEPEPLETIAGTLAYMAPEQTGRINRSIDSRSDLYSLGVTLYEMFTGALPFAASDPLEWVHCHVARTPVPASERNPELPPAISAVIMKLLAKAAEERYQTAKAVELDLRRCLEAWQGSGEVAPFALAAHDFAGNLVIPEKLYGREQESRALEAAFEQVKRTGESKLVLISGYSGVGKSSLVNELHKLILLPRGLFASGKFEQHERDVPYATFARAFQTLVRKILVKKRDEVEVWTRQIRCALGPNGQLVAALIPELEFLIGKQSPVPKLGPREELSRFQVVFRRFLAVFAREEHPLVLFVDDLQWLDAASLTLIEHLATHRDVRHLLLIGAYRDGEVTASHPLATMLETIRKAGKAVEEIALQPLSLEDVQALVGDALRCEPSHTRPLAHLVHQKTAGNPFFVIQFLRALHEEHLLEFDARMEAWTWDLQRIQARDFTDNVVELMVGELRRLPEPTLEAVKHLAALGSGSDQRTLRSVHGGSEEQLHADLWSAARAGLVLRLPHAYRFAHDRVQEAAYELIPEARRAGEHLRIARLLLAGTPEEALGGHVFEIVNHFNRSIDLIVDPEERATVLRLNTLAGARAKAATAYASARTYFARACELLQQGSWQGAYEDALALTLNLAECEYLVGHFQRADELFTAALGEAHSDVDRAKVYRMRDKLYQAAGRYDDALRVGLEGLSLFALTCPESEQEIREATVIETERVSEMLSGRRIAELAEAPRVHDEAACAALGLLMDIVVPAYVARPSLFPLLVLKGMSLSLRVGNIEETCLIYCYYAIVRVGQDDFATALELSEMALHLNEKFEDPRLRGVLLFMHASSVCHWCRHITQTIPLLEQAFVESLNVGDLLYATYTGPTLVWHVLESGAPLAEVRTRSERYAAFVLENRNETFVRVLRLEQQFIACLQGRTRSPDCFDDDAFSEMQTSAQFAGAGFKTGLEYQKVMKQYAALIYGRFEEAACYGDHAELTASAMYASQFCHHSLALAALYGSASPQRQCEIATILAEREKRLELWAKSSPENFGHRLALLRAELARIEGRCGDAMTLYEQAIAQAGEQRFVQYESLAYETAARFYASRGWNSVAEACLRRARAGYLRWGALGKVQQLDREHPGLEPEAPLTGTATIGASLARLDLMTVIKASQAVSGEIVVDRLIERLLSIAVEHAGAERGLLILLHEGGWLVEAEAKTGRDGMDVRFRHAPAESGLLPQSMLEFVRRTGERVLLDDAAERNLYSDDEYVQMANPRSVLCIPLLKQSKLIGALYLENNLTPRAFTPDRVVVLDVLASQAAISLENARLYDGLRRENDERRRAEERFSKAFHDSPAAMAISRLKDDVIVDANDRCVATFGFSRAEFVGHSALELGLVEPAQVQNIHALVASHGSVHDLELVAKAKFGAERTLLVSLERIELDGEACLLVTYLDVTDRRRIEAELRQSQKMEAIGRLAGGVAHDFNNLLTVICGYGSLALSKVSSADPLYAPLHEILSAGEKAAGLTRQLLAHSRRQPLEPRVWNLNALVSDMQRMLRRIIGEDVELVTELDPALPSVVVDRGHIEQAILNLVINARDAMPSGGKLTVTTRSLRASRVAPERRPREESARCVELIVSDTGSGMSEAVKAHLFEPFFTTKETGKGTGLGLATVYGLVKQSGGTIAVESEMGRGSTFRLVFPGVAPESAQQAPSAAELLDGASGHENVLVVEDDPDVRNLAIRVLEARGYAVTAAANGRAALDLLPHLAPAPALVISDVVMPDMGGRELADELREVYPDVPILFMSGYAEQRLEQLCGARHFLQKPFAPSELTNKVRELLDVARVNPG